MLGKLHVNEQNSIISDNPKSFFIRFDLFPILGLPRELALEVLTCTI